jgi:hypothetical protein
LNSVSSNTKGGRDMYRSRVLRCMRSIEDRGEKHRILLCVLKFREKTVGSIEKERKYMQALGGFCSRGAVEPGALQREEHVLDRGTFLKSYAYSKGQRRKKCKTCCIL